ncbi:hypothetical protein F2Q70_00045010 [Brassica cretica]|uniref:Uncharacterized protein n=1 Tax=Brassica cretica TaxID=69181 RepID=A0A8S9KH61_BRACR|nr:hypothetical protein F2Q70_00045010 [Brassica cretica]
MDEKRERMSLFCIRYAFQAVLYAIWRERNKILHGEKLLPLPVIKRMIEKGIRNKISLMRSKRLKGMEKLMQFWFLTRIDAEMKGSNKTVQVCIKDETECGDNIVERTESRKGMGMITLGRLLFKKLLNRYATKPQDT